LIFANEQRDVVEVKVALGVRDQFDRYLVRAWIPPQRSGRELGKLLVIALGKIRPDLADVLLNDVEVVQQPVARRTDVESALGPMIQFLVDSIEDYLRVIEANQQRARATLLLGGEKVMAAGNRARAFPKSFGTQHLAANRANEFFAGSSIAGAAE
jgi:hypothetical protein